MEVCIRPFLKYFVGKRVEKNKLLLGGGGLVCTVETGRRFAVICLKWLHCDVRVIGYSGAVRPLSERYAFLN